MDEAELTLLCAVVSIWQEDRLDVDILGHEGAVHLRKRTLRKIKQQQGTTGLS